MPALRRFAVAYLCLQSLAVMIWWLTMLFAPSLRGWFIPAQVPAEVFLVSDFGVFLVAGPLAAWALSAERSWANVALAFHAGGTAYATFATWSATALYGGGMVGSVLMLPTMIVPCYLVRRLR